MIGTTITPKIGNAMAQAVKRGNAKRRQRLELFYKAVNAVTSQADWDNVETVTLAESELRGHPAKVYIEKSGCWLNLRVSQPTPSGFLWVSQPYLVGQWNDGWQVAPSANESGYLKWNGQVAQEVDKAVAS